MRKGFVSLIAVCAVGSFLAFSSALPAQTNTKSAKGGAFDPHDLSGVWREKEAPAGRGRSATPELEPALTPWAKANLVPKRGMSHALAGGAADPSGAGSNTPDGEYPGENCEPIAAPGQYAYLGSFPFDMVMAPDRVFQMFENHREWRTFWVNRDHPKDPDPSYYGDSSARWDGDTLVVDTIGFNGKDFITVDVGHRMSDTFHLVERFRRIDHDHLELRMTMSDPKAWGDKSWGGFRRVFTLVPTSDLEEYVCSASEYKAYDDAITTPVLAPNPKK